MSDHELDEINVNLRNYKDLPNDKKQKIRKTFFEKIQKSNNQFIKKIVNVQSDLKYLNLILGASGAGKSTLFNYLNGLPMIVIQGKDFNGNNDGCIKLDVDKANIKPDQTVAPIGHGYTTQTAIPNFYKLPKQNITYVDCRGQFSTNDIFESILNSYYKFDLATQAQQVKLTLVINYHDIYSNRATIFKQILTQVGRFIGDWNQFILSQSISLVITEAPSYKDVTKHILLILKQFTEQILNLDRFKPILENIIERNAIAVFLAPSKCIKNIQQVIQANGDMSLAEYYIPEGQKFTPNPNICTPEIINQVLRKTKFMKKVDGLFVHNLQYNAQIVVDSICRSLIEQIKEDLYKIILDHRLGMKQSKNLTQAKKEMESKIKQLEGCKQINRIIEIFKIDSVLLVKHVALRRDLDQFITISNEKDLQKRLALISNNIILHLNNQINLFTQSQLQQAIKNSYKNDQKLKELRQQIDYKQIERQIIQLKLDNDLKMAMQKGKIRMKEIKIQQKRNAQIRNQNAEQRKFQVQSKMEQRIYQAQQQQKRSLTRIQQKTLQFQSAQLSESDRHNHMIELQKLEIEALLNRSSQSNVLKGVVAKGVQIVLKSAQKIEKQFDEK